MIKRVMLIFSLTILLLGACASPATETIESPPVEVEPVQATEAPAPTTTPASVEATTEVTEPSLPFELISIAFEQGASIPVQYSCDGEDISPSLAWGDPPAGTQSLALIMDDPDAPGGTWDHWIVFDIPSEVRELPEGTSGGAVAATFGKNSWGRNDYGGPCPPGGTHRYFFKLYALDTTLSLDKNADKKQVLAAMDGHILAEAELMGTFSR